LAGGRIVFIGEYTSGVYADGVTAENNLLQQLGNFIQANTSSLLLSGNNSPVTQSAIQLSPITAGLTGLLFGGAGALTLPEGSPAAPLVIYNEQVLIAVAPVPGT
jgi:hypothetical protein